MTGEVSQETALEDGVPGAAVVAVGGLRGVGRSSSAQCWAGRPELRATGLACPCHAASAWTAGHLRPGCTLSPRQKGICPRQVHGTRDTGSSSLQAVRVAGAVAAAGPGAWTSRQGPPAFSPLVGEPVSFPHTIPNLPPPLASLLD